jgi:predicted permease
MEVFFILLFKLMPFYILIFLGYIGGKYLHIKKESIATILLYFISPVVIFNGIFTTALSLSTFSIPVLYFLLCSITTAVAYILAGFVWKDGTRNVLAFTAGSANTGFFGLPVAVAFFGNYVIGIMALIIVGTGLFQSTIGFFLAARSKHTRKDSILKVLQLPMLYAFLLGVSLNLTGVVLPDFVSSSLDYFSGAFIVLGMMLIGIAVADVKKTHIDIRYFGASLAAKYILWPMVTVCVIWLDSQYFHIYDPQLYNLFFLMSVVPVAIGIVSYATILQTNPERVSLDVLISTIVALIIIPFAITAFIS